MHTYTIVTNNAKLLADAGLAPALRPVAGGVEAIYDTLSEMLQSGYRLISSPLPANVPLIRSPVRSVIVEKTEKRFDVQGLLALEKARDRTTVLGVNEEPRVRGDLEAIDRDQLFRAMAQLETIRQETQYVNHI